MPRIAEVLQHPSRDLYLMLTSCYILPAAPQENNCAFDATSS